MLAKDIYGIGFATADQIAQNVGIPRDSQNRAKAGIDHVLLEATSDGHCALPLEKLKLAAVKLLEVGEGIVEQALSCCFALCLFGEIIFYCKRRNRLQTARFQNCRNDAVPSRTGDLLGCPLKASLKLRIQRCE